MISRKSRNASIYQEKKVFDRKPCSQTALSKMKNTECFIAIGTPIYVHGSNINEYILAKEYIFFKRPIVLFVKY